MTKRIISIVTAILVMLQIMLICPIELSAETPPQTTTYTGTGYTVEYTVKSSWDKTQNIGIKLNNTSDSPMSVWALKYNAHGEIRELYNGEVYKNEGTEYIIRSTSSNSSIEAGKSVEFGYSVTGENLSVPESIVLCSEQREANEAEYSVEFQLSEQWNPTYTAKIVLNNLSQFEMSGWSLSYDSNATVENIWNGKLLNQTDGRITVSGSAENFTIPTGGTTEININGKVSDEAPAAENFKLTYTYINEDIEDDNNGEEKEDVVIFAFGNYDEETDTLEVSWYSNTEKGTYEILKSEDNISYTTIASVTDTDNCSVAGTSLNNGTQYFKVKVTDESGRTAESIPFEVTKNKNGVTSGYIDTDKDGLADYLEETLGTDQNKADTDNDELTDYDEIYITGTDPLKADTDGNGTADGSEDPDTDGLNNIREIGLETDPLNPDTDGDGLTDGAEVNTHGTDPLKYDTDEDKISDGDEVKLGLSPKNPATNGVPDNEYTIPQEVTADSEAMSEINTEDNPYELSVEVKAAGNAENISVSESGYSAVMSNEAILGIIPEFNYDSNCKVDEVVVKFKLEDEALTEKTELPELKGIQRYQIFKFFEDDNMLLPIITEYNEATNTISATTDCLGTYCVMDMGNFLSSIAALENEGVTEEPTEPTPMLMSLNAEAPKLTVKPEDEFNVVFLVDTRKKFTDTDFTWIKENLTEAGKVIINRSANAKVYLIMQGQLGAEQGYTVLKNTAGDSYFNDIVEWEEAVNKLYRGLHRECNLSDGIRYVYEEIDHSVPTFVFDIFHEEKVYYRESDGYDILNKVKEEPIDITLISKITLDDPKGYAIDLSTLGASGIIDGYMFADPVISHIYEELPDVDSSYYMLVSTGLYRRKLNAPITKDYFDAASGLISEVDGFADTDDDGLYDFQEINLKSGLVTLDRQGNVVYPTYYDCTQAVGKKFYVDTGFEAFKRALKISNPDDTANELLAKLNGTPVLPINSDPTSIDTDSDLIDDEEENIIGTSSLTTDTDSDGLKDYEEFVIGYDPTNSNPDGDAYNDYTEHENGTDPYEYEYRKTVGDHVGAVTYGVIFGDFAEEDLINTEVLIGQIGGSFIPIAADLRDAAANIIKGDGVMAVLSLVGFLPVVGDGIKAVANLGQAVAKFGDDIPTITKLIIGVAEKNPDFVKYFSKSDEVVDAIKKSCSSQDITKEALEKMVKYADEAGIAISKTSDLLKSSDEVIVGVKGVWTEGPCKRGKLIDNFLNNHNGNIPGNTNKGLGENFPVVDRLEGDVLVSTKSLDLGAKSYKDPQKLEKRLQSYMDSLEGFEDKWFDKQEKLLWGGTTLEKNQYTSKALELVFPDMPMSSAQAEVINNFIKNVPDGIEVKIVIMKG